MNLNLYNLIPATATIILWLLACRYCYNLKFEDVSEDEHTD